MVKPWDANFASFSSFEDEILDVNGGQALVADPSVDTEEAWYTMR